MLAAARGLRQEQEREDAIATARVEQKNQVPNLPFARVPTPLLQWLSFPDT
jgi:hypothetical protein